MAHWVHHSWLTRILLLSPRRAPRAASLFDAHSASAFGFAEIPSSAPATGVQMSVLGESSCKVTGPSLTIFTCIIAPNLPSAMNEMSASIFSPGSQRDAQNYADRISSTCSKRYDYNLENYFITLSNTHHPDLVVLSLGVGFDVKPSTRVRVRMFFHSLQRYLLVHSYTITHCRYLSSSIYESRLTHLKTTILARHRPDMPSFREKK